MSIFPRGRNFDSKGREKEEEKKGETKGNNGFRGRPSHHWMMVSIQVSVNGFQIVFNWYQFVNFYKFMLALIVLSSITKKGEIVRKMTSLSHCFVILVIE